MSSGKTEAPTKKRLKEARARGEVAFSRDLVSAAGLLAGVTLLYMLSEGLFARLERTMALGLRSAASPDESLGRVFDTLVLPVLWSVVPILGGVVVVVALTGFLQVGPLWTFHPLRPDTGRLSPFSREGQVLGAERGMGLLFLVLKVSVVGWVAAVTLPEGFRSLGGLFGRGPMAVLHAVGLTLFHLVVRTAAALVVLGILDHFYQRFAFLQSQRMTREEVRKEYRESEGDPRAKRARERLRAEMRRAGGLLDLAHANVVVSDGRSAASVLFYDAGEDAPPQVLVTGRGEFASNLVDQARKDGVPVMDDPRLAASLVELADGDYVPEALFLPVAQVIRAAER